MEIKSVVQRGQGSSGAWNEPRAGGARAGASALVQQPARIQSNIMKPNVLMSFATTLALAGGLSLNLAAAEPLKIGDPAPKLQTGKWVQGDAVKEFQAGKAYIVEF